MSCAEERSHVVPTWKNFCISGDIWEHTALLAMRSQDEAAFERSYLQLRNYYTDARYSSLCKISCHLWSQKHQIWLVKIVSSKQDILLSYSFSSGTHARYTFRASPSLASCRTDSFSRRETESASVSRILSSSCKIGYTDILSYVLCEGLCCPSQVQSSLWWDSIFWGY